MVPASIALSYFCTGALAAGPNERFTVEPVASPPVFIERLEALHGANSPAVRLARHVTSNLEGSPSMAFVSAPWGSTGFIWSMTEDVLAVVLPSGDLQCFADSGPCPDAAGLGALPTGVEYDVTIEMGTPSGIGVDGQVLVSIGEPRAVALIRGYSAGDGAPERYDLVRFDERGFGKVYFRDAARFGDVDRDGHPDAELRVEWGDITWSDVAFGDGRGRFERDPKRAKPFHDKALSAALSRLAGARAPELERGTLPCADAVGPALEAYGHVHLGGLRPKPVRLATGPWFSRVKKSVGSNWKQLCPRTTELLVCVEGLGAAYADGFRRCLDIEPD
ncbi:MAG: hypothetical protein IV100_11350 [Myxococcales bacterium]|nr:hypothetical protein [Myxococcales bacterium]